MSDQVPSEAQSPSAVTTEGSGDETPGVNHEASTATGSSDEGQGSPGSSQEGENSLDDLDMPPNPDNAEHYDIDDLPRDIILRALNHEGEAITTMQVDLPNSNDTVWLILDPETEITWAIKLAGITSKFYPKSARKFMAFVEAIRRFKDDPTIRGGILCRATQASQGQYPFSVRLQQNMLSHGYILLAIPDE